MPEVDNWLRPQVLEGTEDLRQGEERGLARAQHEINASPFSSATTIV
jgi:hypothetical protein